LLLDTYTNATFAYSIRRLNSAYTGACCRVYSTGAGIGEQDFGFDSNGILDIDAIVTFVGAGNNGVVVTWYDQSQSGGTGSGTDITQDTANGPLLVDAGSPILVNGLPAFKAAERTGFDTSWTSISQPFTLSSVTEESSDAYLFGNNTQLRFRNSTETVWLGTDIDGGNTVPMGHHGFFGVGNGSSSFGKVSVADIQPAGVTFTNSSALDATLIGSRWPNNSLGNRSRLQEFVLWGSDQNGAGNTSGIEQNINESYLIYQPSAAPTSGLLYDYPDAAAAYSVRQLSNTAIKCMRVRRAVAPFDERDIGFTAGGDLDEAAIVAFGGSDELRVSAWYDQSGQSRHATQITPGNQPQIYDGTAVMTSGSKPAIYAPLASTQLDFTQQTITDASVLLVSQLPASGGSFIYPISNESTNLYRLRFYQVGSNMYLYLNGATISGPAASLGDRQLHSFYDNGTTIYWRTNATNEVTRAFTNPTAHTRIVGPAANGMYFQEYILFNSNKYDNRTGIENNINDYFNIYT
jgi:hypothetical protein